MKKIHISLVFILFIHVQGFSQNIGDLAYSHTKSILHFGERVLGSKAHKNVEEWISKELKKLNITITYIQDTVKTPLGIKNIKNILGKISAKKYATKAKKIVFLAHYDSKIFTDFTFYGANDSASAVGLILALAKYFQQYPHAYFNLEFLFLDGEESIGEWSDEDSLYGSRMVSSIWAKNSQQDNIHSMILLDMVGDPNLTFCKEQNSSVEITNKIWNIAKKQNKQDLFTNCRSSVGDDHIPFIQKGFPIVDIIAYPFPSYWHTQYDTIDNINAEHLQSVAEVLIEYIKQAK